MKKVLVFLLAATFGMAGSALAFHDGGVAKCSGCHTMHNSLGNAVVDSQLTTQFTTGAYLLKGNDQSSACLNCHSGNSRSGYRVMTVTDTTAGTPLAQAGVPLQHTPGGDFAWLQVGTDQNTARYMRGHNIKAVDFGLDVDTRAGMATAPGGSYQNAKFYCSSCHDPHGKTRIIDTAGVRSFARTGASIGDSGSYGAVPTATEAVGAYRLLGGATYEPKTVLGDGVAFANEPPVAVAPSSYNVTTGDVHVAYGSGMAEWCANCHGQLHNDSYPTNLRHPSGNGAKLPATIVANYNAYVKSGDMTGDIATAYNALVPFEKGTLVGTANGLEDLLAATSTTTGAATTDNVMCLSCHRAHASGFNSMLRWFYEDAFVTEGGAYYDYADGLDATQIAAAYYDRDPATTFAQYQRPLCNKCHAKD